MEDRDYIVFKSIGDYVEQESVPLTLERAVKFYRDRLQGKKDGNACGYFFVCKRLSQQEIEEAETHVTTEQGQNKHQDSSGAEPWEIKPDCGNCLLAHECTYYGFPSDSCGYSARV